MVNDYIVPLIFAVAFIVFIWGVFQYFIAGGADEEKRKKGKELVVYGLIGFVLMFCLWGIVTVVQNTLGFSDSTTMPKLPKFNPNSDSGTQNNNSNNYGLMEA